MALGDETHVPVRINNESILQAAFSKGMVVTKPAPALLVEGNVLMVAKGASLHQEHALHRAPDARNLLRRRLATMFQWHSMRETMGRGALARSQRAG